MTPISKDARSGRVSPVFRTQLVALRAPALSTSGFDGVVHVVSYGFHSLSIEDWKEHELALEVDHKTEFVKKWTDRARSFEIDALREIRFALENGSGPLRMITLINKQDLWWSQRGEVDSYYSNGEYGQIIEELRVSRGRPHFDHFLLPCSLQVMNFRTGSETLQETASGYDQSRQSESMAELERHLLALLWSGR